MPRMSRPPRRALPSTASFRPAPRPVLAALVAGLLVGAVTVPAAASPESGDGPGRSGRGAVTLQTVDGGLGERVLAVPDRPATTTWQTDPFTMVAATWRGDVDPHVEVRVRSRDGWQAWQPLEATEHAPSRQTREAGARRGSDLRWVGTAHEVRVRTHGEVPEGLALTLLDTSAVEAAPPGASSGTSATGQLSAQVRDQGAKPKKAKKKKHPHAPRPRIRGRKAWGAKEKWRSSDPVIRRVTKQVHVHHSASSNNYRRADVPGIIQGFYRYHTKSLGWSDIGYNVLVDRFGRAWLGRYGGPMVQGAHTLGFNHNSVGIAVIGDYRSTKPRRKVVRTVVKVAAWHLDRQGRKARGKVRVKSMGSDRYSKGTRVKLPAITGHRHTNHTACPGERLMDRLPKIRKQTQRRINRF